MNYRHDFHAGNFADVFKHAVLTRVLLYMMRKPTPFRFIDTHAGSGLYELAGEDATRTQEWRGGIGRIDAESMSGPARALIAPYLDRTGAAARGEAPYPGSPALAMALLRPFDRMLFCDLHPDALKNLQICVGRDKRAKIVPLDGYMGLNAFLPPVERRGVVLIDPPFEDESEFERLAAALVAARKKWSDGVYMAWHPIKDRRGPELLARRLLETGAMGLRLEFSIDTPRPGERLSANGLVIVNPPFSLRDEVACLMPALVRQLGRERGSWRIATIEP